MRSFLSLGIILLSNLICNSVFADVYEYVDDAGVSHFSDVSADERYVLILKSEVQVTQLTTVNKLNVPQSSDIPSATLLRTQLLAQIEQSARNNHLDSELIYAVIHVESAFNTQAKSNKGAQGLMQLMPSTASRLGVKNSYDPLQNIEGGAKYLRQLLTIFKNDISLALAAYNAGESAVIRYGYKIPPYKETQAYVPKVLSVYKALLNQRGQVKQLM